MTTTDRPLSVAFEEAEDAGSNASLNPTLGDVIAERLSRRDLMQGLLAVVIADATLAPLAVATSRPAAAATATDAQPSSFNFEELTVGFDDTHHVARGYHADVLIRWGDPVLADAPPFTPANLAHDAQARQFGYNNDFLGFIPLDGRSDRGLLVVNHEYTNGELMFEVMAGASRRDGHLDRITKDIVDVEMAAHGGSVIEVERAADGKWRVVSGSRFARRITLSTEMHIQGPAAGHPLLQTTADPTGTRVSGMVNNCAGGITPWGTWLTCEENINGYFWGKDTPVSDPDRARAFARYAIPSEWYAWGKFYDRFDMRKEPNEANRFGWVVEIDPMDPTSTPVKRTAMGRFKHEGAGNIVNGDGRFVVYQGDDERFDYVYRFVTSDKVDLENRAANRDLLDSGTLYVARFNADGTGEWLPLVHGTASRDGSKSLTQAHGFPDQATVLVHARLAADALGATKMDRPEDIEVNPTTGKVYVMLTNNVKRKPDETDAANPRPDNKFGHIIEITPDDGDHAALGFTWEILLKCGDPSIAEVGATYSNATTANGWFSSPDNCVFDSEGRLWIATDGNSGKRTGRADGIWAIETSGALRGTARCFFQVPRGAEMCGPCFTPDQETFFVAVQHPGEANEDDGNGQVSTFANPSTRWPDFDPAVPPRPSIVAITRQGGGKIAS